MDFNKAIELALRTWYPKDHPLHCNLHHPLGKLLGEWGELLDDYMKSLYKPGYEFEPLDELGDIWYYIRILAHQSDYDPIDLMLFESDAVDKVIALAIWDISGCVCAVTLSRHALNMSYSALVEIAKRYDITLQQLTDSNWQKLKPGSERGEQWMKARQLNV